MEAREQAWRILCSICIDSAYSNLTLKNEMNVTSPKDKALVTQIVYGTLQNSSYVHYMWEDFVKKEPDKRISILLDMSVFQLLCMDKLPSYAVVNDAVNIAKKISGKAVGNLVNAVLHKVIKRGVKEIVGSDEEILAIRTSHPLWIVHMWKAQYGWDTTCKICESNLLEKPQCARVNTLKTTRASIIEEDDSFIYAQLGKDALYYTKGNIANTELYAKGYISIQDEASQQVVDYMEPQPNERILDVCSAPGTKATHIAQRMQNQGYILAGDVHEHRVLLIEESAKRLGIDIIHARCMDGTQLEGNELFDRVLCDVPCSGYGVLGRKSDIKYHMKSEDMDTLIPLQQRILTQASKKVKEDGILIYSTCTLNKKENEKQIQTFLKNNASFICEQNITIFPYEYNSDGFFIARLKKQK